ncbi:hypothetical protein CcaCcLH18_09155 [Colletotrichum camelliae]|nr:hypothetical protein CcaCcLH18_09155 [Colletotrichum camelliae]
MAKLTDLPPEMIRHIGSFPCPDWLGELMLDHLGGYDWIWDVYGDQNDDWESLFNFSYTSRLYKQILTPETLRSIGIRNRGRDVIDDTDVRSLFDLLRLLLHNPAASCGSVRTLFVLMPWDQEPCELLNMRNASYRRNMQLLEEAAQGLGFDIWTETLAHNDSEEGHSIRDILTEEAKFQPNFLKGFLIGLLILHLPKIRDLTIEAPAISLVAMTKLLRRVQELRAAGSEKRSILHLHSVAASACWHPNYDLAWDFDFAALFSLRPQSSVYFQACQMIVPLTWSSNITSLALREMVDMTTSTLTELICSCSRLTRFIYTHEVDDNPDVPSPHIILQALKKHSSSLEVLCLSFLSLEEQYDDLPAPYIDSFDDFTRLQALWINSACFGTGSQSSVLRTIPTSLERLHLAGDVSAVAHDLEWWAGTLTEKSDSPDEEDIDSLASWGFSSDDESEDCGSQGGKGDSHDQAEDELDIEEEFLEQEEDEMNRGEEGEDEESEEDESEEDESDEGDDEEEEYDVDECRVDDDGEYEHDEDEFEEDEFGQDKNELEKYEENVFEEYRYTEDEYEVTMDEEGEREDRHEGEQDRTDYGENQQNENDQADNQVDIQEDNQAENQADNQADNEGSEDETDEDSDKENEGEDEVDERRPNRHIPSELAYDQNDSSVSSWVTDTFANYEFIDFRGFVDSEPGQWYSRAEDPKERLWIVHH